jgi:hypothetical protein
MISNWSWLLLLYDSSDRRRRRRLVLLDVNGAARPQVLGDLHPLIQGLPLDLQTLHVVGIELVHLLSQPSGSGVGFAPLLLLPVSLGHQAAQKRDRRSPLPFLSGEFHPLAFVLQSHDAGRKEKGKHVKSGCPLHGTILVLSILSSLIT